MPRWTVLMLSLFVLGACQHGPSVEEAPAPVEVPREFRGMWIATVANIDWPKRPGGDPETQRAELRELYDMAAGLGLNAVVFQIRPTADAIYPSELEPWSEFLTGAMGKPPEPLWDPLAFAIEEAHARGLEFHAWFNPYRARHSGAKSPPSADHVSQTQPAIVKEYGGQLWMDPGDPRTQAHSLAVVRDVVRRYDLDGVHYDDYFYPYPVKGADGALVPFPDDESFAAARRAGAPDDRGLFRRQAVDRFVEDLYAMVKEEKPWVKVGISPFGIWRPGHPPQIQGFDAYDQLHADALRWFQEGHCDYFTPQLYWGIAKPEQSFVALLQWWAQQNERERHLWPGLGTYKIGEDGARQIPAEEIGWMVTWSRHLEATGQVHFSAKSLQKDLGGIQKILRDRHYRERALVPASRWLDDDAPRAPLITAAGDRLEFAPRDADALSGYVVYLRTGARWRYQLIPRDQASFAVPSGVEEVRVSAVDRAGNEGPCARYWPIQA